MYVQCKLQKGTVNGITFQTTFIPEEHAKIGKIIDLKENGKWDHGWCVVEVYNNTKLSQDKAVFYRDIWKHHRKATDM